MGDRREREREAKQKKRLFDEKTKGYLMGKKKLMMFMLVTSDFQLDFIWSTFLWHPQCICIMPFSLAEKLSPGLSIKFLVLLNSQSWFCSPYGQSIRMANLSLACCHTVNGVSRMHLETLKTRVFKVILILHFSDFSLLPNISWELDLNPA